MNEWCVRITTQVALKLSFILGKDIDRSRSFFCTLGKFASCINCFRTLGCSSFFFFFSHSTVSWDHERVKSPPKSPSKSNVDSRSICSLLDYVGTSLGRTLNRLIAVEAQLWKSNPQLELPGHKITIWSWHRDCLQFFLCCSFYFKQKTFKLISLCYFQSKTWKYEKINF